MHEDLGFETERRHSQAGMPHTSLAFIEKRKCMMWQETCGRSLPRMESSMSSLSRWNSMSRSLMSAWHRWNAWYSFFIFFPLASS